MVHAVKLAVVDGNLGIARILPLPAAVLIVPEAPIDHVIHTRVAAQMHPSPVIVTMSGPMTHAGTGNINMKNAIMVIGMCLLKNIDVV